MKFMVLLSIIIAEIHEYYPMVKWRKLFSFKPEFSNFAIYYGHGSLHEIQNFSAIPQKLSLLAPKTQGHAL